jgi:hypothetical protein
VVDGVLRLSTGRSRHASDTRYKRFTIEVEPEPVGEISSGRVLSMLVGYVAVVHISSATIPPRRLSCDDGRPFTTEGETLMRGYGTAQRIIDEIINAGEASTKGCTP